MGDLCLCLPQPSVRLTPTAMLYAGRFADRSHLLKSARYLRMELPVRLAHQISDLRNIPFMSACHPALLCVHESYIRSFQCLSDFPPIVDLEGESRYTELLQHLLHEHRDTATLLLRGVRDTKRQAQQEDLRTFLDRVLTARLGMRILVSHHLALHVDTPNHLGIINTRMSPKQLVEKCAEFARRVTERRFGSAPSVRVTGHVAACFPYIQAPLEYVLPELLVNAMRASMQCHVGSGSSVPDVVVTIANNDIDFIFRISDRGGGIPHEVMGPAMDYFFTTEAARAEEWRGGDGAQWQATEEEEEEEEAVEAVGGMSDAERHMAESRLQHGPWHGHGVGLALSRAFGAFLGGSLALRSMQGIGTDVYLRLRHIDGRQPSFRL
uniref:Protein-serine/threonine kinase n=1 Tax=Petromyzon marinus TaxID=7757 RepID=A0AAJ7WJX8_PETMA|nr:3-methyl-2-oxobutanoate dehydrogenase [lipoamide] kinase, mitochondrial-like isoform X2 [Petromyzon marinus]